MKMKRLVATMLALLLVVSLLPIGTMAEDEQNNTGEVDCIDGNQTIGNNTGTVNNNSGTINNNGTVDGGPTSGTVNNNYGAIGNNYGTVGTNKPEVKGSSNPTISANYGLVNSNENIVEENKAGGTIENNSGTVGSRNDDAEKTPDTNKGNHGEIYGNTGTVIFNDGKIDYNGANAEKNDAGDVVKTGDPTDPDATVVLNQGEIGENHGKVGTNNTGAEIYDNYGTVDENKGRIEYNMNTTFTYDPETGELIETPGVTNAEGGVVNKNYGTVKNEKGGVVYENTGTVENEAGGLLNDMILSENPGSEEGTVFTKEYDQITGKEGTYVGTWVDRGYVKNEDGTTEEFQDGGVYTVLKQAILNAVMDLKEVGNLFKKDGYEVIGYTTVAYGPGAGDDAAPMALDDFNEPNYEEVDSTDYEVKEPLGWLRLIWGKIKTVAKPSGDPEAKTVKKTVPTSLSGDQLKVGAYVRCGNMTFVIIEVTDTDIRVATANKLSEQDLADLLGCLKKNLTDAQISKLIGEPELLEQELVNFFFGGRNEHIAFRAARDLFA